MTKKYLVCPEQVFCGNDKDICQVSAEDLIRFYRVDPGECEIYNGRIDEDNKKLTLLLPDYTGEYVIPGDWK